MTTQDRVSAGRRKRIRRLALSVVTALACCIVALSAYARGPWQLIRDEDGIVVSRQNVPGISFVAFRGEGDVNAPLLRVASVLVDVQHDRDWMEDVVESRILRRISDAEFIVYSHVGTPPTMSDRDFVMDVTISVDPANRTFVASMHSVIDPAGGADGRSDVGQPARQEGDRRA